MLLLFCAPWGVWLRRPNRGGRGLGTMTAGHCGLQARETRKGKHSQLCSAHPHSQAASQPLPVVPTHGSEGGREGRASALCISAAWACWGPRGGQAGTLNL